MNMMLPLPQHDVAVATRKAGEALHTDITSQNSLPLLLLRYRTTLTKIQLSRKFNTLF